MTCFDNNSLLVKTIEMVVIYMQIAAKTSLTDFENSSVRACFVPAAQVGEYMVKMHADDPERSDYMVGSVGNVHGKPETFRLLIPTPLAVGDRGTVISLTQPVLGHSYPTFIPQLVNVDGYHVIPRYYGAPSFRVGRLVAIAWLPRPVGATEVDHLDGNPANDALDNLEWVTHSQNLRRGRHSRPRSWEPEDQVLMLHEGYEPRLVHPSKVTSISGSPNGSHILRRGTRKSANGWYMRLNPSFEEAMDFVEGLPLKDKSYYLEAVANLFDSLEID